MGFGSGSQKKKPGWSAPYGCPGLKDCRSSLDFEAFTKLHKDEKN